MTQPPDFDQLVGADVDSLERQRLRRMHSLLVQAGPPAELSPALESGPTFGMTIDRRPKRHRRRLVLLAAAIAVLALAFLGGYISGNGHGNVASAEVLKLGGTLAAPHALASLQVEPVDAAGNWPMHLSVEGLPKLRNGWDYEVYLMRGGKPWGSCGSFKVATEGATTVDLNAPYRLKHGDSWVVTRQPVADAGPGTVVLRPA